MIKDKIRSNCFYKLSWRAYVEISWKQLMDMS